MGKKTLEKKIHPCEIYETLDRASDKGPLRPAQDAVLKEWYTNFKDNKDVILKLHTGQGKTLIGLLILQSRLNQDSGPALYLCHNNYLVEQTCMQADSFGINYTTISDRELPDDFIDGKSILITSVQKLFNGMTKFGLGSKSMSVSSILMDDSHACIDVIKDACKITLKHDSQPYNEILQLFGPEIEKQGIGTYADIKRKDFDSFLAVPYWDWQDKQSEVAEILSKHKESQSIKYAWPLLKDIIKDCFCVISGDSLEITPYITPLSLFGSYAKAEHRIFMSATLIDDSFFLKGLGLSVPTIKNPLIYRDEKWSGEKMILIPSLIDSSLDRTEVVNMFAKPVKERKYGVVALVPSFKGCRDWEGYGATVATKDTIEAEIEKLKARECEKSLVIVNRYDGIDLPDNACRILIFDSRPYFESLLDRYLESTRSNSDIIATKLAQTIEQGLGRGVRGEKDYCVIILTGSELIKAVRSRQSRRYFSEQTRKQIEIGLDIAEFAKDEGEGNDPKGILEGLINQTLKRDEGWKEFYTENMDEVEMHKAQERILSVFEAEQKADIKYQERQYQAAATIIQTLIDEHIDSEEEKGWYLQEIARYIYPHSRSESNKYQIIAHKKNTYLFMPKEGMEISKISAISFKRIENIKKWVQSFDNFEELKITLDDMLSHVRFGVKADRFEHAVDELAKALGFLSQRPDKEWKAGPDNLWKVKDNEYLLIECKSSVDLARNEINKDETGQMNNACAWFTKNYGDVPVKRIMIIPTKKVNNSTGFNYPVEVIRESNLRKLINNVKSFFHEFKQMDLQDLSETKIQELLVFHNLTADNILGSYSETPRT
nr:DEAD/DEAH box helicase family protein [Paenibacillus aquistagni]